MPWRNLVLTFQSLGPSFDQRFGIEYMYKAHDDAKSCRQQFGTGRDKSDTVTLALEGMNPGFYESQMYLSLMCADLLLLIQFPPFHRKKKKSCHLCSYWRKLLSYRKGNSEENFFSSKIKLDRMKYVYLGPYFSPHPNSPWITVLE